MQHTNGNFYGTTWEGGNTTDGTIFALSTGLGPFVKLVRTMGIVGQSGGILGQGLTGTTSVSINGTPANFTVLSDTYIQATVPAGATSGMSRWIRQVARSPATRSSTSSRNAEFRDV
jgi:hypothetical protein